MNSAESETMLEEFSKKLRAMCIEAARNGFEDASMSGLCTEGAMEAAIGAIQSLDIKNIVMDYLDEQSI